MNRHRDPAMVAASASWPYPFWIAHRGAGKLAPENTLAAFRLGARHGWRAFECDVKLSADGVPFLLHDATLDRTTSGRGVAGRLPWQALSTLDAGAWHGARHAGEPMPTLEAVARHVRAHGHALNVEIKPTPGDEAVTGRTVAREAARLWSEGLPPGTALSASASPLPLLSSFRPDALAAARDAAPHLPRALLLDALRAGWLDEARSLGCVAVVARHRLIDAAVVTALHAAGLRALAYTVNDRAEAERLAALGVGGLISDAVDTLGPGAAAEGG